MVLVQVVTITESDTAKEQWLMSNVADFIDKGDVLVFANQKARVDIVSDKLKVAGYKYVPDPWAKQHNSAREQLHHNSASI